MCFWRESAGRPPLVPELAKIAEIIFEVGPRTYTGSSLIKTNMALGFDREEFINRIPSGPVYSWPALPPRRSYGRRW